MQGGVGWGCRVGWGGGVECGFYSVFLFKKNFFPIFFFVREVITL